MKTILLKLASVIPLLTLVGIAKAVAQETIIGCQIEIRLDNYHYDTLWWGRSLGRRAVPLTPFVRRADGSFELLVNEPLSPGAYAIVYKRARNAKFQFIPVWLQEGQRSFSLRTSLEKPFDRPELLGSTENKLFFYYLNRVDAFRRQLDSLNNEWRDQPSEAKFRALTRHERLLAAFQDSIVQAAKGSFTARLAQQTRHPSLSEVSNESNWERLAARRQWQLRHRYLGTTDIASDEVWRNPLYTEWLDFYVFKASAPHADSVVPYVEEVLRRLSDQPEYLQYYFNYMVNSFSRMSRYNFDDVFVYLVRQHIEKGKAPWTTPEEREAMVRDANRIAALAVGRPAPIVTLYRRDNRPLRLDEVSAKYLLMVFWNPDCSHCRRELPLLRDVCPQYAGKGLQVMLVCGKATADLPQCWQFIDELSLPDTWLLMHDGERKSNFMTLYHTRSYPKILLVDEQKRILYRRNGELTAPELHAVLRQHLKIQE